MRRLSQGISLAAVTVFTLGLLAVVPVSAQTGGEASETGRSKRLAVTTTSTDAEGEETVTTKREDLRARAKALVAEKREGAKEKSLEVRQKSCEARKANIVKRSEKYTQNAEKHLGVFDKIYEKVLAFKESKNLTAENFDALKAEADAKQAAATEAVAAIADVTTEVDCTTEDPAAAVAAVKESVKNARTALHEYRLSIKDIVVALRNAADTTTNETTEGDTGGTTEQTEGTN